MICKNIEVLYMNKNLPNIERNYAKVKEYDAIFDLSVREMIENIIMTISQNEILSVHNLRSMCVKEKEYNESFEKALHILKELRVILLDNENVLFKLHRWENMFNLSYKMLHKKYIESLQQIKEHDIIYQCSEHCSLHLYIKEGDQCVNGHSLSLVSQEEKQKMIVDMEYDIKNNLESIAPPSKIIETIKSNTEVCLL